MEQQPQQEKVQDTTQSNKENIQQSQPQIQNNEYPEQVKKLYDQLNNLKSKYFTEQLMTEFQDHEDFKKMKKDSKLKKLKKNFEKSTDVEKQLDELNKIIDFTRAQSEETERYQYHIKSQISEKQQVQKELTSVSSKQTVLDNIDKDLNTQLAEQEKVYKELPTQFQALRKQLADNFQQELQKIQLRVEEQGKQKLQFAKEQEILLQKLQEVEQQSKTRDVLFQAEQKKKEIEYQLTDSKFEADLAGIQSQASLIKDIEKQQQKSVEEDKLYEKQVEQYQQQHDDLQMAMQKSNNTFTNLKDQMTNGNRQIELYDQQLNQFRDKQDKLELEIYNLVQKYMAFQNENNKNNQQIETMKGLLNTLQQQYDQKKQQVEKSQNPQ